MALKFANNAVSRLVSSITAAATTIPLQTGEGAKFPSLSADDWFPVTVIRGDGTLEIMRCTARSGDNLTVARGQEGTTAKTFSAGDRVELRLTAGSLDTYTAELKAQVDSFIPSYLGNAGKYLAVNPGETAAVWQTIPTTPLSQLHAVALSF